MAEETSPTAAKLTAMLDTILDGDKETKLEGPFRLMQSFLPIMRLQLRKLLRATPEADLQSFCRKLSLALHDCADETVTLDDLLGESTDASVD